jgi:hypothetical protein
MFLHYASDLHLEIPANEEFVKSPEYHPNV